MIILKAKLNEEECLQKAIIVLKKGGVVAHATDTCYGLAADIWNKKAVLKLFQIKNVDSARPISLICANAKQAFEYGEWNKKAMELAERHWPGALTIIVKKKPDVFPEFFNPEKNSVGLRVPNFPFAQMLIKAFGKPLSSTSANITGNMPAYTANDVFRAFEDSFITPDIILDSGPLNPSVKPSTIVDVSGPMAIVRRHGSVVVKL